jgi:hypothetical protein
MRTCEQAIAEERAARAAFEEANRFKGHKIADLRKAGEKVFDPENWKGQWAASVPHQLVGLVLAAAEFFHADRATLVGIEPLTGNVLMRGNGYQA